MEIRQLRHLIAAVEHRNLCKAAEKVCISHSGLSRSIQSLEAQLGVPLLSRNRNGVEPTEYGVTVIRHAKVIVNAVARFVSEVREIAAGETGKTVFGITQNYAHYLIPELITSLHAERPDLDVTIVTDGFLELVKKLKSEEIDFAFGLIGRIHHSDGLVIEPLMENRVRVYAGSDHPLAGKSDIMSEDLAAAHWAMLSSESVQLGFGDFFQSRGLPIAQQALKSNSITMIRHFVAASGTLTILPPAAVQSEIDAGVLVALDCETPVERTRIGLIFRKDATLRPSANVVVQALRALVAIESCASHDAAASP